MRSGALRVALIAATALTLHTIAGVAQTPHFVDAKDLPKTLSPPYQIHVGDVLEISFFKTPQLDQRRTVGPDGDIYLPLVGRITVVGRTVDDVTKELTEKYSTEMVDPQITVSVQQYSGMKIYVGGEVVAPGMRPYQGGLTVVQAIMGAGGFKTSASLSHVILIRNGENNQPVGTKVNVKNILKKARFAEDLRLAPRDIIFVPRSKIANVNLFVQQFIRNNFPIPVSMGLGFWFNR